jgi:hypothetical protein
MLLSLRVAVDDVRGVGVRREGERVAEDEEGLSVWQGIDRGGGSDIAGEEGGSR